VPSVFSRPARMIEPGAILALLLILAIRAIDYLLLVADFDFECSAKYSIDRVDTRNLRRTPITVGNWMFG